MSHTLFDKPLGTSFYARDTSAVARSLLGCTLASHVGGANTSGKIVEVEAYVGPHDPAAHGYGNRKTRRNSALFGPPGTAYVYLIYGLHWCFNAVTERDGYPAAVLIRALEPRSGLKTMCQRRGVEDPTLLCSGPARLCQALGIAGPVDGSSLHEGPVRILDRRGAEPTIDVGPRIGISQAMEWPLRFTVRDSGWLSRPAHRRSASASKGGGGLGSPAPPKSKG